MNADFSSSETGLNELRHKMRTILKPVSDICEATTYLVYMQEDSETKILASHGDCEEPVVSALKKISDMLVPDEGLSVIQNVRDHHQTAPLLSDVEMNKIQFFAGVPFRSQAGNHIGAFCICDSKPCVLSENQKERLLIMAKRVKTHLMLYELTKELDQRNKNLKTPSTPLNNSSDLTFLLEPELGIIRDVSIGVKKVLGYSPHMLLGKFFTDIVEPNELQGDTIDQWFSTKNQHKGRYTTSVQLIDHQNRQRWFQCDFSADENHWYVTARVISNKKEAEKGVYELKDKLQKIVSVATDLIYQLDWESKELSWGDELTDILGYPHTEKFVNYDWWLDKIHPDDLEEVIHDVEYTVEGSGQSSKHVYRIRTYDGSYKYVMNRNFVDRKEDGTPKTIIGAITDVSELVELEEKSYRNKKLWEELADNAWSATWVRDDTGTFIWANKKFKSLFGLSQKRVIGKNIHDLFEDEIAKQFITNDQKVLESGEPVVFEENLKLNGEVRCYKTNIFPIREAPGLGNILGGVAMDITKENENFELLKRSLEEKNILLAEIHHRVKNNLAVVSGMLHLQAINETDERCQQTLYDSTGRIQTMATIHELLYQSSNFKHLRLDKNIEQLITHITNSYYVSVDLNVTYDMDSIEVSINDAIPCSLIVNEVVTNVIKHAYDEGDSGLMEVSLIQEDKTVTVKIRDDGAGLPKGFDKSDAANTLGLELIQTLTKQLKGTYSYTSLDRGVEFKLKFDKSDRKGIGSNLM